MGHKKKSKHKKKKKRHSSTSSSSSTSAEEWVETSSKSSSSATTASNSTIAVTGDCATKRDDWMSMPGFIPVVSKEKINEERNRERKLKELEEKDKKTYKPGESDRELNPYWKNGGTGVPEEDKKSAEPKLTSVDVGDRGLEWLRKALVRTQEQAEAEGRSLEDVAVERWGSLNKLYELIEEAEKQSKRSKSSRGQEASRSSRKGDRSQRGEDERHSRSHRKRKSRSRDRRRESSDSSDEGYHRKHKSSKKRSQEYSSDSSNDDRLSKNRGGSKSREKRQWDPSSDSDSEDKSNRKRRSRSGSRESRRRYSDKAKYHKDKRKSDDQSKKFQAPKEDDDFTFGSHPQINIGKSSTIHGQSRPSWRKSDASNRKSLGRSPSRELPSEQKTIVKTRESPPTTPMSSVSGDQNPSEETKILTENELAAKMMKAELIGNDALVAKLKKQLEEARQKNKAGGSQASRSRATEEVVVLTSTDKRGFTKPLSSSENPYGDGRGKKRKEKVSTHQAGKRERYFADDDKYTLQNMFEREKLDTVEDSNALFAKLAFKSKIGEDDGAFDMEDVFMEQASRKDSNQKLEEKQRSQAIAKHKQTQRVLESCIHCLESEKMLKHTIIDIGNKCYLCVPSFRSLSEGHCLIVPSYHVACATQLDEEVWEEMQNYRKKLTKLFLSQDEDVVFFETAMGFSHLPHMVLHCVPMQKEIGDMAPIYFKKAILESETEWAQNKKVVDLSQKSVRRAIPKGLPYFAVDFGLQGGFAHVIEDEKLWPRNFAQNIIGGMLDLDHTIWRKERPENFEDIRRKVVAFTKLWRDFSKEEKS
nr:PREDICTED: CWF19-like protein 2 [Bemisia tabaci]